MNVSHTRRIGLLHYTAPPIIGGVESTIAFQAGFLARAGLAPVVLAGEGGPLPEGVEFQQIPRMNSRHPDVLASKAELDAGSVGSGFERLRADLKSSLADAVADLDAILVHNALSLHKNLALTAAIWDLGRAGPTWIAWHHDLAWDRPDYASELHPGEPWEFLKRPLPNAIHIAVSESVRERAARVLGLEAAEVIVIPPGVDIPGFQRWGETTRDLVRRLRLDAAEMLLLLPSRITRRKNIEFAIRVTAEIRRTQGDVRLLVSGPPGPHNPANQAYLEELLALTRELKVEQAVHFLYRADPDHPADLDDDTLADLYRLADALLFPSRDEGFGIPVVEAGLARLPVFCTDLPPFRESGGEDVNLFDLDSPPQQVARRIAEGLAADPTYRLSRRVRRHFDWESILQSRLLPLLERARDA